MIRIILAALLAFSFSQAEAKIPGGTGITYYVAAGGCSDSNSGTDKNSPWCSIAKVNSFTFSAGDSVLFQGGKSFSGNLIFTTSNWSGTPLNPGTVGVYDGVSATINSTSNACLSATNVAGFIINGLNCIGTGTTSGISFTNSQAGNTKLDFVMISNVFVSGYGRNCIEFMGASGTSGFKNVSIYNATASGCTKTYTGNTGSAGIYFGATPGGYTGGNSYQSAPHQNVFITNSLAIGNTGVAGSALWVGSGIVLLQTSGGVIQKSRATLNGTLNNSPSGPVGIWTSDSSYITIQNNESDHNCTNAATVDGGGFDVDGGTFNTTVQYNYSHDNCGSGFLVYSYDDGAITVGVHGILNAVHRYNVSQNDGTIPATSSQGCFQAGTDATYVTFSFYGNTCYQGQGASFVAIPIRLGTGSFVGSFYNNIFYSSANSTLVHTNSTNPTNVIFQGNDYFGTGNTTVNWNSVSYSSIALWRAAVVTQETFRGANTSLISDPSLVSVGSAGTCYTSGIPSAPQPCPTGYKIQAGSPMLNAGQNIFNFTGTLPGIRDYYGNVVPAANGNYDVGANQRTQ
jgi:hypothetical protein